MITLCRVLLKPLRQEAIAHFKEVVHLRAIGGIFVVHLHDIKIIAHHHFKVGNHHAWAPLDAMGHAV